MIQSIQVRKATVKDAELLAELAARTFKDAFGEQNHPDDMNAYLEKAFSRQKITKELQEPSSQFFIAYDGSLPVGYAKLRTTKIPSCISDPAPIELERIYADQSYVGKGVGTALMKYSIAVGQAAGFRTMWLGVWKKNGRAVKFYQKWGYEIVGEHEFVVGGDVQYDHIMSRSLE